MANPESILFSTKALSKLRELPAESFAAVHECLQEYLSGPRSKFT